jgi:hypothetical protein
MLIAACYSHHRIEGARGDGGSDDGEVLPDQPFQGVS